MLYVCEKQALLKAVKRLAEVKKTFGDGGGKNYANSQFSDQNRQDAFSMVSAVQYSARGPRWEH